MGMTMRALTPAGDWTFGSGLGNYTTNEAAIEENILTWLQSWVNNCFFALKDGVDWQNLLDVGQEANLTDSIRANILQCYGVMGVNSLSVVFNPRTRFISITANITTIYSQSFQLELSQIAGVSNG
jgi:hypothetical protein